MYKTKTIISTILLTFFIITVLSFPAQADTTYSYDPLCRLIEATHDSGKTITYTYDAVGNMTTVVTTLSQPEPRATHRIVRINCPVDAEVYDSANTLVASIINEEPQKITGSQIVSLIDASDQKTFHLPATESYIIKITVREDCEMSYAVNVFDKDENAITRVVYYLSIALTKGDVLTGHIEDMSLIEDAIYALTAADGKTITPTNDLAGENVVSYTVISIVQGSGTVIGMGTKTIGEFAKLTAIADEGAEFLGWYLNNELISTELSYRFCVLSDIFPEARFTTITIETAATPTAIPTSGEITAGTQIILTTVTQQAQIYYTLDSTTPTKDSTPYTQPITINTATIIKAIATKEGMNDSDIAVFSYSISEDETVIVAFNSQGGSEVESQIIKRGDTAFKPVNPIKQGYFFNDWHTAATGGDKWDFNSPISAAMVLYAKWIAEDEPKYNFNVTLQPNKTTLKPGDTLLVDVTLSGDINVSALPWGV